MVTMYWLQREFRLSSLPALYDAISKSEQCVIAYFHDPDLTIGGANSLLLSYALESLQEALQAKGGALHIFEGDFASNFRKACSEFEVKEVYYSYQVGHPFYFQQSVSLEICQSLNVTLKPYYSEFLFHPNEVLNKSNQPFKVFTPFYKAFLARQHYLSPIESSVELTNLEWQKTLSGSGTTRLPIDLLSLRTESWAKKLMEGRAFVEDIAWQRLDDFCADALSDYEEERDFPSVVGTSKLAPFLNFGMINKTTIYFYLQHRSYEQKNLPIQAMSSWIRQLVWGEFARYLLHWNPQLESEPFQTKFKGVYEEKDPIQFKAWCFGRTGIPIVDAGMRELWYTGFMHNRVRMLVASFLTKNLNMSWLAGKQWFDDTLFDADPANNTMGWQWVSGCGVDAAPYYRLFNPVLQSKKFDEQGAYIKQWLPELKALDNKQIHEPWLFEEAIKLKGVHLGIHYPYPLVDIKKSRQAHLERLSILKESI